VLIIYLDFLRLVLAKLAKCLVQVVIMRSLPLLRGRELSAKQLLTLPRKSL